MNPRPLLQPVAFPCWVCGEPNIEKPRAFVSRGRWAIVLCRACRAEFSIPRPSDAELAELYDDFEMSRVDPEGSERLIQYHRPILNTLLRFLPQNKPLSFLDYGFGSGEFLKLVAQSGYGAYGIEADPKRCQELAEWCQRTGYRIKGMLIRNGFPESLKDIPVDCVTFFQVLEHHPSPRELLGHFSRIQSPGQWVYIECPNNEALYLALKNWIRRWIHREEFFDSLRPPIHINGLSRRSLRVLLERSGYEIVVLRDYPCADGLHQMENFFFYPSIRQVLLRPRDWTLEKIGKSLIRLCDPLASRGLGRGLGLFALARKR